MARLVHKVLLLVAVGVVLWPGAAVKDAQAWGFYGHKRINRMACFTLPPELFPFFKKHIDFVSDHAVDPDRRRYAVDVYKRQRSISMKSLVAPFRILLLFTAPAVWMAPP